MRYLCSVLLCVAGVLNVGFPSRADEKLTWVRGDGELCSRVCSNEELHAPLVGTSRRASVYVCRANAEGQGNRAGYNMAYDRWTHRCTIGISDAQGEYDRYECLCVTKGVNIR
jgi:hypothetical protein